MPDIDPDTIATVPMNKLAVLRADARGALAVLAAIDDCFSPEWKAAYQEADLACRRANIELERLAKNPKTRHGSWRTPADIELMTLGYL